MLKLITRHFVERAYAYARIHKRVYNKATPKRVQQSGSKSRADSSSAYESFEDNRIHKMCSVGGFAGVSFAIPDLPGYQIPQATCSSPFVDGLTLIDVCSANATTLFLSLLNTLVAYSPVINDPCGRVAPVTQADPIYDFIVVGGGAAGSVVASELSAVNNWTVLLVEAGPDEPPGTQIPSNLQVYLGTDLDWKYTTSNESHACLSTNGTCSWPRGKNLGGCTSHHGMAYHRGHEMDYTRWVEQGSVGWSWQEVLPFFISQENNKEIGRVSAKYHGTGGPMTVERFPWSPQLAKDIVTAAKGIDSLGATEDLVGDDITGFNIAQTLSVDGVRQSTPRAYLWPHRDRKNLNIALNATATKVNTIVSGQNVTATGITFQMNGKTYVVNARKEVIVSGGTINSPQLLLLSGIGPKSQLDSLNIPVVQDLPGVGENLHNHQSFGLDYTLSQTPVENELNLSNADLYLYNQTGPMSSTGLAQLTALLTSNYTTANDPDIQIFFSGYQATCDTGDRIADLISYDNEETVRFSSVNVQPRSRGRITLISSDPLAHPYIWANDLAEPVDRSIIYQGIQKVFTLFASDVLKKYNLNMVNHTVPECAQFEADSYAYWDCQIQYNTRPENHQAGTCKMGTDSMAVVAPDLKVHGVQGLRVADASIMPQMVSGNPTASINMIGLRAADFIKKEYGVTA